MPRTAFTVVETATYGEGLADVADEAADQPNGNSMVNTGREILVIINASGGNVVVTVTAGALAATFNKAWTKTLTVATLKTGVLGPFPPAVFGTTLSIDYDVGASITVGAVSLTPVQST